MVHPVKEHVLVCSRFDQVEVSERAVAFGIIEWGFSERIEWLEAGILLVQSLR